MMIKRLLSFLLAVCAGIAPLWGSTAAAETNAAMLSTTTSRISPSEHVCANANCYWEMPMDLTDEAEVWKMLMAPMTVLEGTQRDVKPLYELPDENSAAIGRITCYSQGVHVLETLDNGWSRVECYSPLYNGRRAIAWNVLMQGYIPTEWLREQPMTTRFGIVVDKLDQRLYFYADGHLLDVLNVSTGLPTERNPSNETTSGEFILCSAVGHFVTRSGGVAQMAIRFNRGTLLHEIPYSVDNNGDRVYRRSQALLGQRASEGCIRVQRESTPKGLNMRWLWTTLRNEMGTKIVIWEDVQGRSITPPDDLFRLYYAPDVDARYYHSSHNCYSLKWKRKAKLYPFAYRDLDVAHFVDLDPCPHCNPPFRPEKIADINARLSK